MSSKDNFPKPFPPKLSIRKNEVIRSAASPLMGSEISDSSRSINSSVNSVSAGTSVMNYGSNSQSNKSSQSSSSANVNSNVVNNANANLKGVAGEDNTPRKTPKSDKKVPSDKVSSRIIDPC